MKQVTLPCGEITPALGMGTWMIGDSKAHRAEEIATLQLGIELGIRVIDTAEMYGEGESEKLIGEAIRGRREKLFLVSKVYPHNASSKSVPMACERSLKRLGIDCLDLYLLHWRGSVPFSETVEAFEKLKDQGKIRHWGVSNLDMEDMRELYSVPGGEAVQVNQVLYNLTRRGIEWDLLPWCEQHRIPVMAYSPIEQARLVSHRPFVELASQYHLSASQLALAWLLRRNNMIVIPKTSTRKHLEENFSALNITLDNELLEKLDKIFPPPSRATPLQML